MYGNCSITKDMVDVQSKHNYTTTPSHINLIAPIVISSRILSQWPLIIAYKVIHETTSFSLNPGYRMW